ncbi:hypothetical protein SRB5_62220 [Streptomyces sp. RB5]|uniref:HTH cro/C1-type domain-containing protein n=1 Tax=Streptomyces smaragdinus TaxID=2585196 RepID=A0A7K0CRI4_9ACTN|nr:helix-turn-helix transcriptional regulator [Streptomyces smaragdinus]MQY16030.1 hypothetical protein [Streptomyces smaragdinus]
MTTITRQRDDGAAFLRGFGRQLKLCRERAGLSRAELAELLGYSAELIASIEQGRRIPQPEFIDRADEVLGAGGLLIAAKDGVEQARYPAFFRDFAKLEAEALELHAYDSRVANGLLQTEEYARAVLNTRRPVLDEATLEQRIATRLARQKILHRKPAPLMSFVMEEVLLHRPIGGRDVLKGQLEQLLLVGQQRNVEIQVMPTNCTDHAGLAGPMTLLDTQGHRRMGYVEVQAVSRVITEPDRVREMEARYGLIRAQALTPHESLSHIEKILGET